MVALDLLSAWRFLLLTLLIGAVLLVMPVIEGNWLVKLVLELLVLTTVLVTISANRGWKRLRNVMIILWAVSVAGTLTSVFSARPQLWQWYRSLELLTFVPVIAAVAGGMIVFVRRQQRLTVDSIFATVAAYLLLALLFSQVYLVLITWNPASFAMPAAAADRPLHQVQADMTYFSLVTLATVGYGDILPATHTARMMAMFEAVVGQFYFAVVVALFVGMYSTQRQA